MKISTQGPSRKSSSKSIVQNTKDEFNSIQKDLQEICSIPDLSDDSVSLRATEKNDESVVQDIDDAIVEEDTYR